MNIPITGPTNRGCYCLCSVAHPRQDDICQPSNAVTARDVKGRPVQMCAPCAAAHDAKTPKAKAAPDDAGRSLDDRLMQRADDMPAEQAEQVRGALAYLREAWSGGDHYPDPAEALQVIADNANDVLHILRGETADPGAPGRLVVFRKASV